MSGGTAGPPTTAPNTRNRKKDWLNVVKVIKLMLSEMVNGVNFELLPNMEMLTFSP